MSVCQSSKRNPDYTKSSTPPAKHNDNAFLNTLCNLFQDQPFSTLQLAEANTALLALLPHHAANDESTKEYLSLCRLLAAINYALFHNSSLFGVAD
jgi:hypothetical protein